MFSKIILILIISLIGVIFCQVTQVTQFTSSGTITNDPRLSPGSGLTVNIYYDFINQVIRYDYPNLKNPANPNGIVYEIDNYTSATQSQICAACSAFKLITSIPIFFQETTDITPTTAQASITNDKQQTCTAYQKINPPNSGQIQYIWVTSAGIPCQAVAVDGTTYTFTNVKTGQPAASLFVIPPNSNCPTQPTCQAPIDLVLVLDQSGSINTTEWALLLSFADAVVESFIIGPNQTQIGIVFFSGVDYTPSEDPSVCCGLSDPALPLNFDKSTIKKVINTHLQTGGHTCINCGIKSATTYEPNPNRAVQVPRVMLVLTDGFNNRETVFFPTDVANAKSQGWDMFAVGVKVRNDDELVQIASSPVSSHLLYVGDFFALRSTVNYLTTSICTDFPTSTTCGPSCKGKCICGGQCICPDICTAVPNDLCHKASNVVVNGTCVGCFTNPVTCDPSGNNNCQQNLCDVTTGTCKIQTTVCTPPSPCLQGTCQNDVGCVFTSKCPAQAVIQGTNVPNLCLNSSCDSNGNCITNSVTCPPLNACFKSSCDPYLGCISTPTNCDDGNACTLDTCSNSTGCVHTTIDCVAQYKNSPAYKANPAGFNCLSFTCDPKVGCTSTVKTCDDGNQCTTDSCNSATGTCVNTQITCVQDPNDKCNQYVCNSGVGCVKQPLVTCNDGKACTIDSCNPATGTCIYTPVVCPTSPNGCFTSVCDETAQQCVNKTNTPCNQVGNICTTFACDPATKNCKSSTRVCNPPNLCSTAHCDPIAGCLSTPILCNDNNACTIDQCNATSGACVFTPIPGCTNPNCTCNSTDPCNPKVCINGTCVITPVICPINKCATVTAVNVNGVCTCTASAALTCPPVPNGQCGENLCNPQTGQCQVTGGRVCDDGNPCTNDICTIVAGNPTCSYTPTSCSGNSPCSRKACVNKNGVAVCVDNPIANSFNCTTGSACATGVCNPQTGQCQYTQLSCSNSSLLSCNRSICDPASGKCVSTSGLSCTPNDPLGCGIMGTCVVLNGTQTCSYQPRCSSNDICTIANCTPATTPNGQGTCTTKTVNCNDNNPCTQNDRCVASVDSNGNPAPKCIYDAYLCPTPNNPCQLNQCVNQNGNPVCVTTNVTCQPPDNCTTGQCVLDKNGKPVCQYTQLNCGTSDKCSTYSCDPVHGCVKTNNCNDNNNCTNDLCDPQTGKCSYTPVVCNSTDICKTPTCSPTLGCLNNPVNCSALPNITALLDPCHYPICAPNNGCQIAIVPNTIDTCGFCLQPGKCGANRDTGISPGAIAGAVIGGAVVAGCAAAGIGIFAASRASDGFAPATDNAIVGANTNPLYAQDANQGTNPFHNDNVGGNDYVPLTN